MGSVTLVGSHIEYSTAGEARLRVTTLALEVSEVATLSFELFPNGKDGLFATMRALSYLGIFPEGVESYEQSAGGWFTASVRAPNRVNDPSFVARGFVGLLNELVHRLYLLAK